MVTPDDKMELTSLCDTLNYVLSHQLLLSFVYFVTFYFYVQTEQGSLNTRAFKTITNGIAFVVHER